MGDRYQNIESATLAMGYGKLINPHDTMHAFGITDTDHLVWLPIMYNESNNWYNIYNDKNTKEMIVEIANNHSAKRDWKLGILQEETRHVIARYPDGEGYTFDDIGEYCAVFSYQDHYTTIYAKCGSPLVSGTILVSKGKRFTWTSSFATSEAEAVKRFDELAGPALSGLR